MSKEVKRYVARDIREHTSTDAWAAPSAIQLVDARDYDALLAERDRLRELAETANYNCRVVAGYLSKHMPALADGAVGWCNAIDDALQGEQPCT